jgi:hypothetical protein
MRFARVEHGHKLRHRLIYKLVRLVSGHRAPDVVRTLFYRADFFGGHHNRLTHVVMRGPSEWSVGERELFAAFVSRVNQCPY